MGPGSFARSSSTERIVSAMDRRSRGFSIKARMSAASAVLTVYWSAVVTYVKPCEVIGSPVRPRLSDRMLKKFILCTQMRRHRI